jgi:hypothetical protein
MCLKESEFVWKLLIAHMFMLYSKNILDDNGPIQT